MGILPGCRPPGHQIEDDALPAPVEQLVGAHAHGAFLGHVVNAPAAVVFLHHIRN